MFQKVQVIGYLGRDPEARFLPNGDAVTNFSVAATERWTDKASGEKVEHTEWFSVTSFGRLAEICGEYLSKGTLVLVEGTQRTEKWTDKDGVERYSVNLRANTMKMLGGSERGERERMHQERDSGRPQGPSDRRPAASPRAAPAPRPAARASTGFDDMDDDIPF